jgi:thiamine biosynthesis lipoprotein
MGSPCELQLHLPASALAAAVAEAAIAEVRRLEARYSRYLPDSITSQINRSAGRAAGIVVDDETASLLDHAQTAFRESDGLFDITSGVLRHAWHFSSGRVPEPESIAPLLERVGWKRVGWQRPQQRLPAGMEIDLGGCVKEYAADRVAFLCRKRGLQHGLVDLGGDLCVIGPHPDGSAWRVGVRHPRRPGSAIASLSLCSGAVATSGDYERFMLVGGHRYSHLLDPRSGWPVQGLAAVSVIASHCVIAGTASTIAMLKGPELGPRWLDALGLPNLRIAPDGRMSGTLATTADEIRPATQQPLRSLG